MKKQLSLGSLGDVCRGLFPEPLPRRLIKRFPLLEKDRSVKTSRANKRYNCVAWSAKRDKKQWWEPFKFESWYHWPEDLTYNDYSIENFFKLFENLGYEKCDRDLPAPDQKCNFNFSYEFFYKKIAIYAIWGYFERDKWGFAHVSDQLHSGKWTSKLGNDVDIRHNSPLPLEGDKDEYGKVVGVMKKKCNILEIIFRTLLKVKSLF